MRKTVKTIVVMIMLVGLFPTAQAKHDPHPGPSSCEQVRTRTVKQCLDGELLQCVNEMRKNPRAFYRKYVESYIRENQSRFTRHYTESLRKTMLASGPLPLFSTLEALRQCASLQARYIASEGGRLTHSQGNIGFAERMKQAGLHCLAENLYAAHDPGALQVVIDLLIDQNIPSLGHRKNLLNPAYGFIGIVNKTIPADGGKTIVVMDFGCKQ